MATGYPPIPIYPIAIDSDFSLFVVYNTTESKTTTNNQAWSEEIQIEPVSSTQEEIWPDNGFGNISGELFYYDSVEKNQYGKVFKLKRCARNIGGTKTQFNPKGTFVRGYVVAEHHNQLSLAIRKIQNFIGINFDERKETLDYKIRRISNEVFYRDDFGCPDVTFIVQSVTEDQTNLYEKVISYDLVIDGGFDQFTIDFGDGVTNSTSLSGLHTYSPNSNQDPVVFVTNGNCEIIQTPTDRASGNDPQPEVVEPDIQIAIPIIPAFPDINIPAAVIPETTLTLPQIVFPCLNLGGISSINIPSIIMFEPPLNIPSIIEFIGAPTFSPIEFIGAPTFSPIEFIGAPTFSPIEFIGAPTFSPIEFIGAPTFSPIEFIGAPTFSPIEFIGAPTFSPIEFINAPSFGPIEFINAPSFSPIEFVNAPTFEPISFIDAPTFEPISFIDAPTFEPISFVNAPTFDPISFASVLSIDAISFINTPTFDPISFINAPTFEPISFIGAPTFDTINFAEAPTFAPITFDTSGLPSEIAVTGISDISCTVNVVCPTSSPASPFSALRKEMDSNYKDGLGDVFESLTPEDMGIGIPSVINLIVPEIPKIQVDVPENMSIRMEHDIPSRIKIESIRIPQINFNIDQIKEIPREIKISYDSDFRIPSIINIQGYKIPTIIKLDTSDFIIPESIKLVMADIPDIKIKLDTSDIPSEIKVTGIPDFIELKGSIPSIIQLSAPDNLEVPLVFRGDPIPIRFDTNIFKSEDGQDLPCFALMPCPKK